MEEPDDFLNVKQLSFEGDIDEQVASLLEHVRLSRGQVVGLRELLADLEDALRNVWPGCEVHPFGSIITGLGIKSSDIDVYVMVPHNNHRCPVIIARNVLRQMPWKFAKPFAITSATVPVLKFFHIPTGFNCDVSFKSPSGVRNSKLIFHLLSGDSRALSLTILIKYWSKVFKFTGTNLLPNYALTMMVVFYLQSVKMLAPIVELQRQEVPYMVDMWNTAFNTDGRAYLRQYNDNLYHMLGGFFKFYSQFQFNELVISPFVGVPVLRKCFENFDLTNDLNRYKDYVSKGICKPLRIDTLVCIQDPFEHSRNCAVCISAKLFTKIQSHFQYAAKMYDEMPPDDFLKAVFTEDPQASVRVVNKRKYSYTIHRKLFKPNYITNRRLKKQVEIILHKQKLNNKRK